MFKFVESKLFFYTCTLISLIIVGSVFIVGTNDTLLLITNIFTFVALLGLLFFTSKETKELMKVCLTALIVCTVFSYIQKFSIDLVFLPAYLAAIQIESDKIRSYYSIALLFISFIAVGTIYIDHCIINFTNLPSKIAININKFLAFLMIIITISDKCGWIFFKQTTGMQVSLISNIRYIDTTFLVLTIVSAEALINSKRAARLEKETKE